MLKLVCCIQSRPSTPTFGDAEFQKLEMPVPLALKRPLSRQSRVVSDFSEAGREIRRIFQGAGQDDNWSRKSTISKLSAWSQRSSTSAFLRKQISKCSGLRLASANEQLLSNDNPSVNKGKGLYFDDWDFRRDYDSDAHLVLTPIVSQTSSQQLPLLPASDSEAVPRERQALDVKHVGDTSMVRQAAISHARYCAITFLIDRNPRHVSAEVLASGATTGADSNLGDVLGTNQFGRDMRSNSGFDGSEDPKAQTRLCLNTSVSEQTRSRSAQEEHTDSHNSETDEASHIWERALQAHAFELASGRPSPAQSKLGHRGISPGVMAVKARQSIRPRSSLAVPHFPALRPRSIDSKSRRSSGLEHSPTLAAVDKTSSPSQWMPAVRRKRSFPAWSRFPSHTRDNRNGAAGMSDGVTARDFAATATESPLEENVAAKVDTSKNMSSAEGRKRRGWISSWHVRNSDWRRYGKGNRSSIAVGGILSHPELEMLPQMTTTFNANVAALAHQPKETPWQSPTHNLLSDYRFGKIPQNRQDLYGMRSRTNTELEEDLSPFDAGPQKFQERRGKSRILHHDDALAYKLPSPLSRKSSLMYSKNAGGSPPESTKEPHVIIDSERPSPVSCQQSPMSAVTSHIQSRSSTATFRTAVQDMDSGSEENDASPGTPLLPVIQAPSDEG